MRRKLPGEYIPSDLVTPVWQIRIRPQHRDTLEDPYWLASIKSDSFHTCFVSPIVPMSRLLVLENGIYDWKPEKIGRAPFISVGVNPLRNNEMSLEAVGFDLRRPFRIIQTEDTYTITQGLRGVILARVDTSETGWESRVRKDLHVSFADTSFEVEFSEQN